MLFHLLFALRSEISLLNVTRYITFRTAAASLTALGIGLFVGPVMIRKLREDWTRSRGGREAWRQFHDQFLTHGGPPIPMVRRQMMGDADTGSLF